eukprot:6172804-Pleurochrysis_carterae.AAC.4
MWAQCTKIKGVLQEFTEVSLFQELNQCFRKQCLAFLCQRPFTTSQFQLSNCSWTNVFAYSMQRVSLAVSCPSTLYAISSAALVRSVLAQSSEDAKPGAA